MSAEETRAALTSFYEALSRRDGDALARLYTEDAVFEDEVFALKGADIGRMWSGLLRRARDFQVSYTIAKAGQKDGVVEWTARYKFGGRREVVNVIVSELELFNGRVTRQRDTFDFPRWAAQAFGVSGRLFGRFRWFRRAVSKKAALGLGVPAKP